MNAATVIRLVADDVREGYPELSDVEALAHVRNTLRLPEAPAVPGSYPLEEDGTPLAKAYRAVLEGHVDAVASYADGSGVYSITREGMLLWTEITDARGDEVETFATLLVRAQRHDEAPERDEYQLTDRFSSCDDLGRHGVVWIDGKAYLQSSDVLGS